MSEVITPLEQLLAGQTFTADEDGAFVITEHHTHSDILRFVVDDLGLSAAIFILRNLTKQHQPTQSDDNFQNLPLNESFERITGAKQMMIDIDVSQLDGIVRAWLKDTLETVQHNSAAHYVHPEDAKLYKKDIKALKWVLEYIGDN